LLHLDVKPSNVLLAADGQPMLLDFHLAREPITAGLRPRGVGGTPLYVSPEQFAATLAVSDGQPVPAAVDGRSDVYSLGLTLYEALGGGMPVPYPRTQRLDACNPQVSVGLADIVHKCLAPRAADRYPDAGALAADLRRHLADLPLRGVPNRSWRERWRKWRRRRPQALLVIGLLALLLGGALLGGLHSLHDRQQHLRERLARAEYALREGQESLREGRSALALEQLERGLEIASTTAGGEELARNLDGHLRQARRLESASRLNRLAEAIRFACLADSVPEQELHQLAQTCRALWQTRERVLSLHPGGAEDASARQVRTDLLDLAVIWVDLRLRLAPGHLLETERRDALQVLAEAETLFGRNRVLLWKQRELARALGLVRVAGVADAVLADMPARTAWEHYAVGRLLLREGDLEGAASAFEEAVTLDPGGFWPNFYHGACAHRRGRHEDAVNAFSVCVGVAPASAPSYYNRALAETALQRPGRALRDYDWALKLDANLAEAAFNRALLHHEEGRPRQALADVRQALTARPDYPEAQVLLAELQGR
jgi:tetratricopeptide (TPR) repeat protein